MGKFTKNKQHKKRSIRFHITALSVIFLVFLSSWIYSTLHLPAVTIWYHQTLKGTDITITSPIYFSTRQKVHFTTSDTVTVCVFLPRYPIHEVLPFQAIIEHRDIQDDITQYKARIIGTIILG